jgi:hypothetical protein
MVPFPFVLVSVPGGERLPPPKGECHFPFPLLVQLLCQQGVIFILSI